MKEYIKLGNKKVFYEYLLFDTIELCLIENNVDCISRTIYYTRSLDDAVEKFLSTVEDMYTEEYIKTFDVKQISKDTYILNNSNNTNIDGRLDIFCRVDKTKYFKHLLKNPAEFSRYRI